MDTRTVVLVLVGVVAMGCANEVGEDEPSGDSGSGNDAGSPADGMGMLASEVAAEAAGYVLGPEHDGTEWDCACEGQALADGQAVCAVMYGTVRGIVAELCRNTKTPTDDECARLDAFGACAPETCASSTRACRTRVVEPP